MRPKAEWAIDSGVMREETKGPKRDSIFRKRRAQNETRFIMFVETRSKTRKGICLEKVKSKNVRKISPEKIAMHWLQNIREGK